MENAESKYWYVMRATYRRELAAKQFFDDNLIDNFIPMRYKETVIKKKRVRRLVPAINNLIFVLTTPQIIERMLLKLSYLRHMYTKIDKKSTPMIVDNAQMSHFIAVSGNVDEKLLYFTPEEIDLAKGTKVRVIAGDFKGMEGVFLKVKGARDRRVVVSIDGVVTVATVSIPIDMIEIIE